MLGPRAFLPLLFSCLLVASATAQSGPPADAALPDGWVGPGPMHKLLLDRHEAPLADELRARGAVVWESNYGAFTLLLVDEQAFGGRAALLKAGLPVRDEHALIPANGWLLDGTRPEATLSQLPSEQRIGPVSGRPLDPTAGLYLVQFVGPVRDRWLAALGARGARVVQSMPMNAYVVALPPHLVPSLAELAATDPSVQYVGVWQPAFRMTPGVRLAAEQAGSFPVAVTIQLVDGAGVRSLIETLAATASVEQTRRVGPYVNVEAVVESAWLVALAHQPSVFAIELRGVRVRLDERQGQIVAGNVGATAPTGPGYLGWLAGLGFDSSQFGSFSVNVVDDATSLTGHPDLPSSRVDFQLNPTNQGGSQGGHGFLNGHIVAGFNNSTASAVNDGGGYNFGLGIAPFAHVGGTAIFGSTGSSGTSWENSAYANGARISSNSWGFSIGQSPLADYDSNAQAYDFIVRDARSGVSGNQEYTVVFAAGNDGPGGNTVSSPGTAKNIITVGASENVRQSGTDGCGVGNSGADNIRDLISFSSQGPVNASGGDGRWKPEIVAPGTHIEAGVPQSNYNGSSVCNIYWPGSQTLYGWSSGTSHSTPAVAGGAALVRQHFLNQGLGAPSPAMVKAVLVNSATYLTGAFAADTLPSDSQGMGRMDLGRAFDTTPRLIVDQTQLLSSSGATYTLVGNVSDPTKPFRVSLVWTDAPGPTSGAPWVNNLDLGVSVGGATYKGNVFSGANSVAGGLADMRNNTESVYRAAGVGGAFTVTVTAASIGGDGVPGNGDSTDQDFALVVYNATTGGGPGAPVAAFSGSPTSGNAPLNVGFTDLSTGSITGWAWTFGDGGTSSVQNPSHTYNAPGNYTVSLTVIGPGGNDVQTSANYITVAAPPSSGIGDGSFESQAAGSVPSAPWTVDFGSGHVISPSGVANDNGMPVAGSQWAELAADSTNGATPPSNPGGVGNPPVGGAGISQTFSYPSGQTLLSFSASFLRNESPNQTTFNDWMSVDLGDGATTVNLFYKDTFSATSGSSTKYGYAMTAVEQVTADLAALFPSSSTSTTFTLSVQLGNGADNVQPSKGYIDDVRLDTPVSAPVAAFAASPTSGLSPLNVGFTDLSSGAITSWLWAFGDGSFGSTQNPSHVYAAAGSYTVSLTVAGPGGSDIDTQPNVIVVTAPPSTGISDGSFEGQTAGAPPGSPWGIVFGSGHVIDPTGVGSDNGMPVDGSQWAEMAADSTNGATPPSNPGGVTNPPVGGAGISQSFSYAAGQAQLGFSAAFLRNENANQTQFNDWMSVDVSDGSTTVNLFYKDTFSATAGTSTKYGYAMTAVEAVTADLSALFPSSTSATAFTLTALVGNGADNLQPSKGYLDDVRLAAVSAAPVAAFSGSPTSGTVPLTVAFADASSGAVTSWLWSFGDGAFDSVQNPSHTYAAPGTYTVSLQAFGPGGNDTETKIGYVNVIEPAPVAAFSGSPTSGTLPLAVVFTDASTGTVSAWLWNFGDGATSPVQNPGHTYTAAGAYTVSLTATGPGGNDTETKIGYINVTEPAPVAAFSGSPTSGTLPLSVVFTDASTGTVSAWLWDFGDGATSPVQNPGHTYTAAGAYTVSLTASGPGGSDITSKTGYIVVDPVGPPPQGSLLDGSFELQTAGAPPAAPWIVESGSGHVIAPAGVASDGGMPVQGSQWAEIVADSTNNATPPSNPGGVTLPPVGGAGIGQGFTYAVGQSRLRFHAAFLRNENPNQTQFNDWMSVDVSDGTTTVNVYYKDTFSPTAGVSSKYGYAMTPVEAASVDLKQLFPASTPLTQFTISATIGNGGDGLQPSVGYLDDLRLVGSGKGGTRGSLPTPPGGGL